MPHSAECNINIQRILDISSIDSDVHDNDLVYIDGKSLKVVSHEIRVSQTSLKKKLREKLERVGRKSLAKRSAGEQPITYKDLKLLAHYIKKPRTIQTLLDNRYQQLCVSYDSLPDLVKENMKNKNIMKLPDDIHVLHLMMTCPEIEAVSLALIKHLATRCMDIDSNSRFEILKEESEDCLELIFKASLNSSVELQKQMEYVATLYTFKSIWQQQNSKEWNQLILESTILACVHCSAIECSFDHDFIITDSSELLDSGQGLAIAEEATESSSSMSDKTSSDTLFSKSIPEHTKHLATQSMEIDDNSPFEALEDHSIPTFIQSLDYELQKQIAYTAKLDSFLSASASAIQQENSDDGGQHTLDLTILPSVNFLSTEPVSEKPHESELQDVNTSSLPKEKEMVSQEAIECSVHNPLGTDFTGLLGLLPATTMAHDEIKSNDTQQQQVSTASSLLKLEQCTQISLALSQEAIPKNTTEHLKPDNILKNAMNICNEKDFFDLIVECDRITRSDLLEREANVKNYINDPDDEEKCEIAINALKIKLWFRNQYFNLTRDAGNVSKHPFFKKQLNRFIKKGYFLNGLPPWNEAEKKFYMKSEHVPFKTSYNIHYVINENVTPTEAMLSLHRDLWLTDETTYMQYVVLDAILLFWKSKLFDQHFSEITTDKTIPFSLTSFGTTQSKFSRVRQLFSWYTVAVFKKGAFNIFQNHVNYENKNPYGDFAFLFGLCDNANDPKTFVLPCFSDRVSIPFINAKLVNEYNKKNYSERNMTSDMWKKVADKHKPIIDNEDITVDELILVGGGMIDVTLEANFNKIYNIKKYFKKNVKT